MQCDGLKYVEVNHDSKMLVLALEGLTRSADDCRIEQDDLFTVFTAAQQLERNIASLQTNVGGAV